MQKEIVRFVQDKKVRRKYKTMIHLNPHTKLQVKMHEHKKENKLVFSFLQDQRPLHVFFSRGMLFEPVSNPDENAATLEFEMRDPQECESWFAFISRLSHCMAKKYKSKYDTNADFIPAAMQHRYERCVREDKRCRLYSRLHEPTSPLPPPSTTLQNVTLALREIIFVGKKYPVMIFGEVEGVSPASRASEAPPKEEDGGGREAAEEDEEKGGACHEQDYEAYMKFTEESNEMIHRAKKEIVRCENRLFQLKQMMVKFIKACNLYQVGEENEEYQKQRTKLGEFLSREA